MSVAEGACVGSLPWVVSPSQPTSTFKCCNDAPTEIQNQLEVGTVSKSKQIGQISIKDYELS